MTPSTSFHFLPMPALLCVALACCAVQAQAQSPSASAKPADTDTMIDATIVKIDGKDILLDVGGARVSAGYRLKVYRRIEVRHPVTKRKLVDRFVIGELVVAQPGAVMSIAHESGTPTHPFAVGDAAEDPNRVPAATPTAVASGAAEVRQPQAAPCPACDGAAPDRETSELVLYWRGGLAQAPPRRIELYNAFLQRHPNTQHKRFVLAEIAYLTRVEQALQRGAVSGAAPAAKAPRARVRIGELTRATHGEPLWLSLAYDVDTPPKALLLHARKMSEDRYETVQMQLDVGGHARARVPQALIVSPGLEFFVEAADAEGRTTPVHASADAPHAIDVPTSAAEPPDTRPGTRVRFQSELVSFDGTSGKDYFFLTEGDFLYRLRYAHLYAVRMGYGHYEGKGGTVEELDELGEDPRPAGFSYGFFEAQFSISRLVGLAMRGTVGLGRPEDEDAPRDALTGGFQLRLRIGPEDGTQLELAGELLPEVGQRAFLGLRFEAIKGLPMRTEVHVTDQPVNSNELAVRLVYELGFRVTDRIALALRPSYQLRTISHAGAGIGAAATFDW